MYTCRKCKSEIEDNDRYCFCCGSYIGEPVSINDNWEALNRGVNSYTGTSIVESDGLNENSLLNNKVLRIFMEQGNNVIKSLIILIKHPASGINNLLQTFSGSVILGLTFFVLILESIVVFFILKRLEAGGLALHLYSSPFITLTNILLGLIFCSIIVSCSCYLITFYVFKKKGEARSLWSISIISVISLFIGITIILIFDIKSIILIVFFLLIGFMFSILSMFSSVKKSIENNEDLASYLVGIIYLLIIVSGFSYYNYFLK